MPSDASAAGLSARLRDLLADISVLPVLTVHAADDAVPLARALHDGGLKAVEITLRTAEALEAIGRIRRELPDVLVGAGTVNTPELMAAAADAGVAFAVSPGLTGGLVTASRHHDLPLLPGVATPSEAMVAANAGLGFLKLFPASAVGGVALLKALNGPLPDIHFCPTGGINASTYRDYLELPNVRCVGGSWMAPREALAKKDWSAVTRAAQEIVP
ncbi:MAG: bifunctional 4-hydroxy-2-oxoglutarate aldolase/2-dehydro-3-deoxy-phosphogluconate aldolase [Acidobacteriota bacterium]